MASDDNVPAIERIDPAYRAPVAAFARLHGARVAADAALCARQGVSIPSRERELRNVLNELRWARAVCAEWTV